jgi:alpha-L-fucosidase
MWDSKVTEWNAAKMGPKRDTVGEMATAIRKQGMKFFTAFHHAANWFFFPRHKPNYDTNDEKYSGLYGPHLGNKEERPFNRYTLKPNRAFCDWWKAISLEVIDNYQPDLIWWDFGLGYIHDRYRREVMAYYYNKAEEWGKEVEIFYKIHNLPPGLGVIDYEMGRANKLTYYKWISDTTVDKTDTWGYARGAGVKLARTLVHNLVDRVAKHGSLVLNVGPKSDGTLPKLQVEKILEMGQWLKVNGEAIYGTTPWIIAEEGPTKLGEGGMFSERQDRPYTPKDIRFTAKNNAIYAIALGWPYSPKWTVSTIRKTLTKVDRSEFKNYYLVDDDEIKSIRMLGLDQTLEWTVDDDGLHIGIPAKKPCPYAVTFKITWQ